MKASSAAPCTGGQVSLAQVTSLDLLLSGDVLGLVCHGVLLRQKPWLLAVGASDATLRVYDRRMAPGSKGSRGCRVRLHSSLVHLHDSAVVAVFGTGQASNTALQLERPCIECLVLLFRRNSRHHPSSPLLQPARPLPAQLLELCMGESDEPLSPCTAAQQASC